MKLSQVKELLPNLEDVRFRLQDNSFVPEHFHVTEVGIISKNFIDCGGKVRHEKTANFQLWDADDYEHRLKPDKLLSIILLSERVLGMENLDVEVEYQSDTIGKYDLEFDGQTFVLVPKRTACLASENCGTGVANEKTNVSVNDTNCCAPNGSCC